jgi:mRNA-degrading endonuclease RelE of RelBE toxin-antitoxin system
MGIVVKPTDDFVKELKRIAKKHRGILADIADISLQLKENPRLGTDLGQNFYKIRMAISGSGKGKSGGARIITYVLLDDQTVLLVELYLKSEYDNTDVNTLLDRLRDSGLI